MRGLASALFRGDAVTRSRRFAHPIACACIVHTFVQGGPMEAIIYAAAAALFVVLLFAPARRGDD
jgi:hypothetical protein